MVFKGRVCRRCTWEYAPYAKSFGYGRDAKGILFAYLLYDARKFLCGILRTLINNNKTG